MTYIIVLTGERGIGKTTVCRETVALAEREGYPCGGILTLTHGDGPSAWNVRRGRNAHRAPDVRHVMDVSSGAVRRLTVEEDATQAVELGRFRFDPHVLSWGNRTLGQATPCDLLVIDEIGPLEVERGEGWVNAFVTLRGRGFELALVVVRPELLVRTQLRLPNWATVVLAVTQENRNQLPGILMGMLRERG
jgi:nucleoside-triphosphatase THEP1